MLFSKQFHITQEATVFAVAMLMVNAFRQCFNRYGLRSDTHGDLSVSLMPPMRHHGVGECRFIIGTDDEYRLRHKTVLRQNSFMLLSSCLSRLSNVAAKNPVVLMYFFPLLMNASPKLQRSDERTSVRRRQCFTPAGMCTTVPGSSSTASCPIPC